MASDSHAKSTREKVRRHRIRLREQGWRPIQFWVPDVFSLKFRSEAKRQVRAVAASSHARDDQAFVDAISDWGSENDAAHE